MDTAPPRHVFMIPNGISALVALAVIRYEQLEPRLCMFVRCRSFRGSFVGIPTVDFRFQFGDFGTTWRFWQIRNRIKELHNWVTTTIGHPYRLYLPHSLMPYYHLMQQHPLCVDFAFIEEGLFAYYNQDELNQFLPASDLPFYVGALKYLCHGRSLPRTPRCFNKGFRVTYGISQRAFPWTKSKVVLPDVFVQRFPAKQPFCAVFALCPDYYDPLTPECIRHAVANAATWIQETRGNGAVAIKQHPGARAGSTMFQDCWDVLKSHGLEIIVLPQDFLLEDYLLSNNALIITSGSSIDLYESYFPGRAISLVAFANNSNVLAAEILSTYPFAVRNSLDHVYSVTMPSEAN